MRPHEEKWEKDEGQLGTIRINDVVQVQIQVRPWECGMDEADRQARAVEAALLALPDMARALADARRSLMGDMDPGRAVAAIDAALRKAGVLP